jgi:PP-loop superfamily ATP-utilizing enzyme
VSDQLERCKSCILPVGTKNVEFDAHGVCRFCRAGKKFYADAEPVSSMEEHLDRAIRRMRDRGKNREFDCLVGLSGGRDSTFLVYRLREVHRLRVMAAYYRTPFTSDVIDENVRRITGRLKIPLVEIDISTEKHRDIARKMLNEQLEKKGLHVEQILVRYFRYSEEIQKNIEEKKLKDQLVFKNKAEARAATEEANLKRVIEEGKAAVRVKLEEGKVYVMRKNAEKDLYVRTRKAEADLLVKLAEARRTELKNKALQMAGSDRMVGLKMAEVLKGLNVIVLPSDGKDGYNPLDLRDALTLFEVKK